ncbi:MAG: hypothetical protein ABEH81_12320 [Halopenitus sp.]
MSLDTKLETLGTLVTSRRAEKIAAALITLLGLVLVASPFTVLSGLQSGLVLVTFLVGGFFLVLGALLASERTPTGDAVRYQA